MADFALPVNLQALIERDEKPVEEADFRARITAMIRGPPVETP
jgi:hypothetical protein